MATTLQDPRVAEALDRMYTESREQMSQLRESAPRHVDGEDRTGTRRRDEQFLHPRDAGGRPTAVLAGAGNPSGTIVEFGMSFGISALHLASAVRDNGTAGW